MGKNRVRERSTPNQTDMDQIIMTNKSEHNEMCIAPISQEKILDEDMSADTRPMGKVDTSTVF